MVDVQPESMTVTFDGYEDIFFACPVINVWRDYDNRLGKGIVTSVTHGERGTLLERRGDACKVRVGGKIGWLTFYFIKELKQDWQEEQLNGIPS